MKQNLKEIRVREDIDKLADNPLTAFLKEYFEKNDLELLPSETQGDQYSVNLMCDFDTEQVQKQFKLGEAKQVAYDIKYKLEQAIQDAGFRVTQLSLFGVNVVEDKGKDKITFGLSFMYSNVGNVKVIGESKDTYLGLIKKRLIEEIEKNTGKKVVLESYSQVQKKTAEKILNSKDGSYIIKLINRLFKNNFKQEDFDNFEKLHKKTLTRLIDARNNVVPGEARTYPLQDPEIYKQLIAELVDIVTPEELKEEAPTQDIININETEGVILDRDVEDPGFEDKYTDYELMRQQHEQDEEIRQISPDQMPWMYK